MRDKLFLRTYLLQLLIFYDCVQRPVKQNQKRTFHLSDIEVSTSSPIFPNCNKTATLSELTSKTQAMIEEVGEDAEQDWQEAKTLLR